MYSLFTLHQLPSMFDLAVALRYMAFETFTEWSVAESKHFQSINQSILCMIVRLLPGFGASVSTLCQQWIVQCACVYIYVQVSCQRRSTEVQKFHCLLIFSVVSLINVTLWYSTKTCAFNNLVLKKWSQYVSSCPT